ncbi:hypothetical protein ACO0K7_17045 [Undibacterium sp. Ji67W]
MPLESVFGRRVEISEWLSFWRVRDDVAIGPRFSKPDSAARAIK